MNHRQLQYILTLAEEGSFSSAAQKLYISQPSLSQYVQKIEDELDVKLFERTKPLKLTYAGELYVQSIKNIIFEEDTLRKKISDIKNCKTGKLIIGTTPYCAAWILPSVIKKFSEGYPCIHISINEATENELTTNAQKGSYDFTISLSPIKDIDFTSTTLLNEEYVLAVSEKYYLQNRKLFPSNDADSINLSNFEKANFVTMNPGYPQYFVCHDICKSAGFLPKTIVTAESLTCIHSLIQANIGISILPHGMFLPDNTNSGIRVFKVKDCSLLRPIVLSYRTDQYISQSASAFISCFQRLWRA